MDRLNRVLFAGGWGAIRRVAAFRLRVRTVMPSPGSPTCIDRVGSHKQADGDHVIPGLFRLSRTTARGFMVRIGATWERRRPGTDWGYEFWIRYLGYQ